MSAYRSSSRILFYPSIRTFLTKHFPNYLHLDLNWQLIGKMAHYSDCLLNNLLIIRFSYDCTIDKNGKFRSARTLESTLPQVCKTKPVIINSIRHTDEQLDDHIICSCLYFWRTLCVCAIWKIAIEKRMQCALIVCRTVFLLVLISIVHSSPILSVSLLHYYSECVCVHLFVRTLFIKSNQLPCKAFESNIDSLHWNIFACKFSVR